MNSRAVSSFPQTFAARGLRQQLAVTPDLVLIGVMDELDFEWEHLPGSHSVPLETRAFERRVTTLSESKKRPIVVYDETANGRSAAAAERLRRAGFTSVIDFPGGVREWKGTGEKMAYGAEGVPYRR